MLKKYVCNKKKIKSNNKNIKKKLNFNLTHTHTHTHKMSGVNYELSYALNNQCIPCNLIGTNDEKQYGRMLSSSSRAFKSSASQPFPSSETQEYIDTMEKRHNLATAVIVKSYKSGTALGPQLKHGLAGYGAASFYR